MPRKSQRRIELEEIPALLGPRKNQGRIELEKLFPALLKRIPRKEKVPGGIVAK
jgi:hypothetical protein